MKISTEKRVGRKVGKLRVQKRKRNREGVRTKPRARIIFSKGMYGSVIHQEVELLPRTQLP